MDLLNVVEPEFDSGTVTEPVVEKPDVPEVDATTEPTGTVVDEPSKELPTEPTPTDSAAQSHNKNHPMNTKFAEMRRSAKESAALKAKQDATDQMFAELAKAQGFEGITTAEEYASALKKQNLANKYRESKDPADLIDAVVDAVQTATQQNQPVQDSSPDAEYEQMWMTEVTQLNKDYGLDLKEPGDVLNLPKSNQILDYMDQNKLSLSDAYRLVNADVIAKQSAKAAKQAAVNQVKGNAHINKNSTSGQIDDTPISKEELSNWQFMFPGKSIEQCKKEIKAYKSEGHVI